MYFLSVTNYKPSQSDNTAAAATGGVVTVVVVVIIAVTVIVIVVLLRNRRGPYSSGPQKKYVISLYLVNILLLYRGQVSAIDITAKSNEAYELTKISGEPTYMSVYQWFNVWKHGQPLQVSYSLSTVILMLPINPQQRLPPLTPPNLLLGTLSMSQYNCVTE